MVIQASRMLKRAGGFSLSAIFDITVNFLNKTYFPILLSGAINKMKKSWIEHVLETRRKGNRGKKTMTHKEAMKAASVTWPKGKKRILRQRKKQLDATPPEQNIVTEEQSALP